MGADPGTILPPPLEAWFARRGWVLHPHQRAMLDRRTRNTLLIAPTGSGKTLAGFLPSLVDLVDGAGQGMHTLYVSPLKALAADIGRNLRGPVEEMGLAIRIEDRTGDTPQSARNRQRAQPPDILLTTPESLVLLLSQPDAPRVFRGLRRVIVDEVHALAGSKRGDQLSLTISRLRGLVDGLTVSALSATVENPRELADWIAPGACDVFEADPGPDPEIGMLEAAGPPPWSGAGGRYAVQAVLDEIARHQTTIIFINTRAQAELFFRALWEANAEALPIGLHHGSLSREARQRVEAAMAEGSLRGVVATGSLDLGLDWGDVDLVIQVGAPKNVKRLVQRIGRANHRFDAPSRAMIVPANRFEVLECHAALAAVREKTLDPEPLPPGALDVLCQHLLLIACSCDFDADAMFQEVKQAGAYKDLSRAAFERCLSFCSTGGYALRAYPQWHRLIQRPDGLWGLRDPRTARRLRMNVGTIIDPEYVKVRLGKRRGGFMLGEVEEDFAATLSPGDSFLIGGQVVRYEATHELTLQVSRAPGREPKIAVFSGTKLAMSTMLANRVMALLQAPERWGDLPEPVRAWLELQRTHAALPRPGRLMVETFPADERHYTVIYAFAGRNANQTLGLLISQRMEETGLAPIGFLATDYALMLWGVRPVEAPEALLSAEGLTHGFETWLSGNAVMKKTFRQVAAISGLIERNLPGQRKTGRQVTVSSDILYDTLKRFEPDHLLMEITRTEALRGLVDFGRIHALLETVAGRIDHTRATRVTPLAAPLMLERGRVALQGGSAEEAALEDEAALIAQLVPGLRT